MLSSISQWAGRKGELSIFCLSFALAVLAVGLWLTGLPEHADGPRLLNLPVALVLAMFLASSFINWELSAGRSSMTLSLEEIALMIAILSVAPRWVVIGNVAGTLIALTVKRGVRPSRDFFNASCHAATAVVSLLVFSALHGDALHPLDGHNLTAILVAVAAASTLESVSLQAVMMLFNGRFDVRFAIVHGGGQLLATAVNLSFGVVALVFIVLVPHLAWSLGLPLLVLVVAQRALTEQRQRVRRLEYLFRSSEVLNSPDLTARAEELVAIVGQLSNAQRAELILIADGNDAPTRIISRLEGGTETLSLPLTADERELFENLPTMVAVTGGVKKGRIPRGLLESHQAISGAVLVLADARRRLGMIVATQPASVRRRFTGHELSAVAAVSGGIVTSLVRGQLGAALGALEADRDELMHQATHDALTGLGNRQLVLDRLEQVNARFERSRKPFALLYLDLDGFKAVNDHHGHASGDELLRVVAERLLAEIRGTDTAARMGGDEFVVLLEEIDDHGSAQRVAHRILESLRKPVRLHSADADARIGTSIGLLVVDASRPVASPQKLVAAADALMYEAKRGGKGRVVGEESDELPARAATSV